MTAWMQHISTDQPSSWLPSAGLGVPSCCEGRMEKKPHVFIWPRSKRQKPPSRSRRREAGGPAEIRAEDLLTVHIQPAGAASARGPSPPSSSSPPAPAAPSGGHMSPWSSEGSSAPTIYRFWLTNTERPALWLYGIFCVNYCLEERLEKC